MKTVFPLFWPAIALFVLAIAIKMPTGSELASLRAAHARASAEEANRALVLDFYDQFFNRHETEEAALLLAEDYRQHNPSVPDGRAPVVSYFTQYFRENPQSRARVVRSATDGDLVYLHIHSTNGPEDRGVAVVDIFRVRDGRIVEHWDVIQPVPAESANSNTMF